MCHMPQCTSSARFRVTNLSFKGGARTHVPLARRLQSAHWHSPMARQLDKEQGTVRPERWAEFNLLFDGACNDHARAAQLPRSHGLSKTLADYTVGHFLHECIRVAALFECVAVPAAPSACSSFSRRLRSFSATRCSLSRMIFCSSANGSMTLDGASGP